MNQHPEDPKERYRDAPDQSRDLHRLCPDEPGQARRVGIWERATKLIRRRPQMMSGIAAALATILLVSGFALWPASDDSLIRVKQKGKLVFATEPNYPPMSFWRNNEVVGFDVDVAKKLAERLRLDGAEPLPIAWNWQHLVDGLRKHNEFDVVIATITKTPERDKDVNFVVYEYLSTVFLGKKGLGVKGERDLAGKVIAVEKDTRAHGWAKQLKAQGVNIKALQVYPSALDVFESLRKPIDKGGAEITFAHETVARYHAKLNPGLEAMTAQIGSEPDPIGIAFGKHDTALQAAVAQAVQELKREGFFWNLREKWFPAGTVAKPSVETGIPYRSVIAHRGASHDAPESTAASYLLARELGADYLELDLQRTKDGVLIVLHDDNLKRTTDVAQRFPERADKPVLDFTLAELRTLDAGTWFNQAYPQRARPSFVGSKILTLDEVIDIAEGGQDRPGLYLETKSPQLFPGIEKELKEKLEQRGWIGRTKAAPADFDARSRVGVGYTAGRVVLQTFEKSSLELLHKYMPQVPKVLLLWLGDGYIEPKRAIGFKESGETDKASFYAKQEVKDEAEFARWLDWTKVHGGVGTGPPVALTHGGEQSYMDLVKPWMNRMTHERGLLIHAYVVDDPVDFERLDRRGVDGFFTNRPAELRKYDGRSARDSIDAILKRHGY